MYKLRGNFGTRPFRPLLAILRFTVGLLALLMLLTLGTFMNFPSMVIKLFIQTKDYTIADDMLTMGTIPLTTTRPVKVNISDEEYFEAFLVTPYKNPLAQFALPDLSALNWSTLNIANQPAGRRRKDGTYFELPKPFNPVLSNGQRDLLLKILNMFSDMMFTNGYGDRFFLDGGSLLGSFRHHDMVPWDDDIDIMVDTELRLIVKSFWKQLDPDYKIFSWKEQDKVYAKFINDSEDNRDIQMSRHVPKWKWGFPFIDIFYYKTNGTHIMHAGPPRRKFRRDVVFPLTFRPFAGYWFPAPAQTLEYVRISYGTQSNCKTHYMTHVLRQFIKVEKLLCDSLLQRYAFVEHRICNVSGPAQFQWKAYKQFLLGEERLVVRDKRNKTTVFYSLCFPMDVRNLKSEPFIFW